MRRIDVDVLIVGAGPGGLQVAHELHQRGADYLVVEAADAPGNFFTQFPRHRRLISVNKVAVDPMDNPWRFDWNSLLNDDEDLLFARYSQEYFPDAADLLRYLADFAARYELRIRYGARVVDLDRSPDGYTVALADAAPVTARRVVVATGMAPHLAPIPGIEHAETYADTSVEPRDFAGARVLIIGKGNSAFETADPLIPFATTVHVASPRPVRLAWNTHYVGHLRATNADLVDTYQLKLGNALLDAEITEIRRDEDGFHVDLSYTHAAGHQVTYHYDRIIAATGFRYAAKDLLSRLSPESCHDGRFPAMTATYRSPNEPGLYFAGTITHGRDYRKTMSGFIHGFRYNARFLARVLTAGDDLRDLQADQTLPAEASELAGWALRRLNTSDALFLQPGYMTDVVTGSGANRAAYSGVPLDWVEEGGLGDGWQVALTLAYGPPAPDPLCVDRSPDPSYAKVTPFLHPVLHLRHDGQRVDELHLLEDLENRYAAAEYLPTLESFFHTALTYGR